MAIQPALPKLNSVGRSPSFQQQDWIAALPAVARNDEDGAARESFYRAVGLIRNDNSGYARGRVLPPTYPALRRRR